MFRLKLDFFYILSYVITFLFTNSRNSTFKRKIFSAPNHSFGFPRRTHLAVPNFSIKLPFCYVIYWLHVAAGSRWIEGARKLKMISQGPISRGKLSLARSHLLYTRSQTETFSPLFKREKKEITFCSVAWLNIFIYFVSTVPFSPYFYSFYIHRENHFVTTLSCRYSEKRRPLGTLPRSARGGSAIQIY